MNERSKGGRNKSISLTAVLLSRGNLLKYHTDRLTIMSSSSSSNNNKHRSYDAESILELGLSLAWGLTGWWLPKYFLYLATESIVNKDTSDVFQVVNNQVVVDFLLYQELVDPPTIPSKCWLSSNVVFHERERERETVNVRNSSRAVAGIMF